MALSVDVRASNGTTTGSVALDESFFGAQPNIPLLHQVVTAQLAAARAGTQSTKTRAEVSGGGAKPFKQKGTGHARQGSTNAPHYTGGGIALGPKPRNYRQHTPRKMVQLALKGALSDRASSGHVAVVDSWDWSEPSTKAARAALSALGITGRPLVVLGREDQVARKSFRNLPDVELILAGELAAYDVLRCDWIVFTRQTVPGVSGWAAAPEVVKAAPKRRVAKAVAPKADEAEPAHDDEAAGADAGPEVVQAALADQADVGPDGSAGRSEEEA